MPTKRIEELSLRLFQIKFYQFSVSPSDKLSEGLAFKIEILAFYVKISRCIDWHKFGLR